MVKSGFLFFITISCEKRFFLVFCFSKRTELENWRINGELDIFSCVYKILTHVPASFELDAKADCTFMLGMR